MLLLVSCMSTRNHLLYFARFCAGSTPKIAYKIRTYNKELCQVHLLVFLFLTTTSNTICNKGMDIMCMLYEFARLLILYLCWQLMRWNILIYAHFQTEKNNDRHAAGTLNFKFYIVYINSILVILIFLISVTTPLWRKLKESLVFFSVAAPLPFHCWSTTGIRGLFQCFQRSSTKPKKVSVSLCANLLLVSPN